MKRQDYFVDKILDNLMVSNNVSLHAIKTYDYIFLHCNRLIYVCLRLCAVATGIFLLQDEDDDELIKGNRILPNYTVRAKDDDPL